MQIAFNGLDPKHTITHGGKIYRNGSVVDMPEEIAQVYIDAHLAFCVETAADRQEAAAVQELELRNAERRKRIKAEEQKGGERHGE